MLGTFDTLFDDNTPTGFFGGYRPQYQNVLTKLMSAPSADPATPAPENAAAPGASTAGAAADANNAGTAADVLAYPDGTPVISSCNHQPYLRPPGLDMRKNLEIGQSIKDASENSDVNIGQANPSLIFALLFLPGSTMDYQRPNGTFGHREMQFRPATYYNYGAMAAKTGYGREEALRNAGIYNRIAGAPVKNRYGLDGDDAEHYIGQGYDDFQNGLWTADPSR